MGFEQGAILYRYRISLHPGFDFGMAYIICWIGIYTYLVGIWFREDPNLEQVVTDSSQSTHPIFITNEPSICNLEHGNYANTSHSIHLSRHR